MKKIKCSYCGVLNFNGVSACFNCKKPFSLSKSGQRGNFTYQNDNKSRLITLEKIGKGICILLLVGIIGGAGVFGYIKYSDHLENQKKIELAEKEKKEIEDFKGLFFDPNTESPAIAIAKLPTRFRIAPPDLDMINKFPFREKLVMKTKPEVIQQGYTAPSYYGGTVIGRSGDATFTTGGMTGGGNWAKFSSASESRMLKVKKITGYSYNKDSLNNLTIGVGFIGEFQYIVKNPESVRGCSDQRIDCIQSYIEEGYGSLTAAWVNDSWEINNVKGGVRHKFDWKKELMPNINKDQIPDLIPNWHYPKVITIEERKR